MLEIVVDERLEQIVLRGEVPVDGALGDVEHLGDRAVAQLPDAALENDASGRLQNPLPALFALRGHVNPLTMKRIRARLHSEDGPGDPLKYKSTRLQPTSLFGGFRTRDAAEDDDVGVGVRAEAVRAVRAARHFARSPEAGNRLVVGVEHFGLRIDLQAAHRVVHARNASVDPVRSRAEVDEAAAVVEVQVLARPGEFVDARNRGLEVVDRDLEEVGDALDGVGLVQDARLGEDLDLVLMVRDGVRALLDLAVEDRVAVLARLLENGLAHHVAALEFLDEALAFLIDEDGAFESERRR